MDQSETLIVFHWNEPETGFPRALLVCSHAQQRRALGSRMACIMCKDHSTKFYLLTAIDTNNTPTSHVSHRRLEGVFQNSHGVERGQYFSLPSSFLPSSIPPPPLPLPVFSFDLSSHYPNHKRKKTTQPQQQPGPSGSCETMKMVLESRRNWLWLWQFVEGTQNKLFIITNASCAVLKEHINK